MTNKPTYIIGLTGPFGSGCTITAECLEKKGYRRISISRDILGPLAKEHGKPYVSRENKQDFGNFAREKLRDDYQEKLLTSAKGSQNVVIECFRNPMEVDFFRDEFPHFYLIALHADKDNRMARLANVESAEEFEKCDERDQGENEDKFGQHVPKCVKEADIVINNTTKWRHADDSSVFFVRLEELLRLLREPFRPPSHKEMLMHLAYSVSLHSTCIQRQVGAVIADENYQVLSVGYNDTPKQSDSCLELFSQCYRKIKKNAVIAGIFDTIKFCPLCGKTSMVIKESPPGEQTIFCNNCGKYLSTVLSSGKELEFCRSLHAEENAILANPYVSDIPYGSNKNMIMFATTLPCMLCAKKIANSGIKKVIFVEPYPFKESYEIFEQNNVGVEIFEGIKSLSFNWIFRKRNKYIKEYAVANLKKLGIITKKEGIKDGKMPEV